MKRKNFKAPGKKPRLPSKALTLISLGTMMTDNELLDR